MRAIGVAIAIAIAACNGSSGTASRGSGASSASGAASGSAHVPAARAPVGLTLVGCAAVPRVPGVTTLGTIGTGRYGTIGGGHGAGYGVGGGGGSHASTTGPEVHVGMPVVGGSLDKAIIRRYIKRNINKIEYCYEKQLLANPKLAGTLVAQFTIRPDGNVMGATATGVDPDVASCVAGVIGAIEFPKPPGGAPVQVSYPLTFTAPAAEPADTADTADAADTAGSDAPGPDGGPAPFDPTGDEWLPMSSSSYADDAAVAAAAASAARTAIAAKLGAATDACVRDAPSGSLRAIVRVNSSEAAVLGGLGDARAEDCLTALLAGMKAAAPGIDHGVAIACDLVHGAPAPWRVSPSPAIGPVEVTPDRITYPGHLESHFPGGVPYLVALDPAVRGALLARVLVKLAAATDIIIAVRDGAGAPRFLAQVTAGADADVPAITIGGAAITACIGTNMHPEQATDAAALDALAARLVAACTRSSCKGAAVLSLDATGTIADLARAADRLRAAGFDRLALRHDATCPSAR